MIRIDQLYNDILNNIFCYFCFEDMYIVISLLNTFFNNYVKSFVHEYIGINELNYSALLSRNRGIKTYSICFTHIDFSKKNCDMIKNIQMISTIKFFSCDLKNRIFVPKTIKRFELIKCSNVNPNQIFKSLQDTNVNKLFFSSEIKGCVTSTSNISNISNISGITGICKSINIVKQLLKLNNNMHELHLESCCKCNASLEMNDLKNLSNPNWTNLRRLSLSGLNFDKSCNNLEEFKRFDFRLEVLKLDRTNVNNNCLVNIITPSMKTLYLNATHITDEFSSILRYLKNKSVLNLKLINLNQTKITSKCFSELNHLDLECLLIDFCPKISNLNDLNIPSLTFLSVDYNNFCDDDIKNILSRSKKLKNLSMTHNPQITDLTLKNICDHDISLNSLCVRDTNITFNGVRHLMTKMYIKIFEFNRWMDYDRKIYV
jgi:hypothetical protein